MMKKRNNDLPSLSNPNKRIKLTQETIDLNTYVSASSIHNYLLNDPIIDYLKLMKQDSESIKTNVLPTFENDFFKFICNKGIEFEAAVINKLFKLSDSEFKQISYNQQDIPKVSKFIETKEEMMKGTPIIYQGVLHDNSEKVFGSPDIIIRSDYINKIVPNTLPTHLETLKAPHLTGNYHYLIIDIKFHTLHFKTDQISLINEGRMKANKGQLLIYNQMLSKVQGLEPEYFYVMGRGYKFNPRCDAKLGSVSGKEIIDREKNTLEEKVIEAVSWMKFIKSNYKKLKVGEIPELFPNMCNEYDSPFHLKKLEIAKELNEITLLWSMNPKNRQIANSNGITEWNSPELTAEKLGVTGEKTATIISEMLKLNQSEEIINITKLSDKWKNYFSGDEFVIDFETVSNLFDNMERIPYIGSESYVFMIGLTHKGIYYNFTAKSLSVESEKNLFEEMLKKVRSLSEENEEIKESEESPSTNRKEIKFFHWGSIENYTFKNILNLYPELKSINVSNNSLAKDIVFNNLLDVFYSEPIIIKNALNFSLKTIGNELIKNKLIQTEGWEKECVNGLEAMILAEKIYREGEKDTEKIIENLKDIIKYNEKDCEVTYHILQFLKRMQ